MALARIGNRIIFFAHIPKTGGASVRTYLAEKGAVALHHPQNLGWSASTPQHMPASVHRAFVPDEFCDQSFSVMRDPFDRMLSEYRYRTGRSETDLPFDDWARKVLRQVRRDPGVHDNHLRPQVDFLRPRMAVFRFEHGLPRIYDWIDRVTGTPPSDRSAWKNRGPEMEIAPSDEIRGRILKFYAEDADLIAAMGNRNGLRLGAIRKQVDAPTGSLGAPT